MRMLCSYLHYRMQLILMQLFTNGLSLLVCWLNGGDVRYAGYAALLSGLVLAVYMGVDGVRFCRQRSALKELMSGVSEFEQELPAACNALQADYNHLAGVLYGQMREARERLEREQEENMDYYTQWVHQIKTPIAAMRLALHGAERPVLKQELFKIERYADLALSYTRLGSAAGDVVIELCDLNPLIRDSVRRYATLFVYKKLRIEVEEIPFRARTDKKWFCFILEQLLSNAIKYTQEGSVHIYAREHAVVIEDTGVGIRSEDLPRVFEKGYTGFNGRIDRRASGIGLYLARRAAGALSVTLTLQSVPGKGTKALIEFGQMDERIFCE